MKTHILSILAAFVAVSSAHSQTFNTISNTRPRYKVELSHTDIKNEASLKSDTSNISVQEPKSQVAMEKETEQIRFPLSVSYPLRQSKLVVTSPYGMRKHPVTGQMKMHNGIDLRANYEPVYAMLPGEVLNTGYEPKGGNFICLKHGSIKVTYCHLSHIAIAKGATVFAGQPIGISGNSGQYTTGPHLHLSVKNITTGKTYSATDLFRVLHI